MSASSPTGMRADGVGVRLPDRMPVSQPALTGVGALRAAGRAPQLPFRIALDDGRELTMRRLLRVLPGKRLVGEAELDDSRVLAKLFIDRHGGKRWQQERAGLDALARAGVPTPALIAAKTIAGGGYALLTTFLEPVESLAEAWARVAGRSADEREALSLLVPLLAAYGRLHAAGLVHEDPHLGNFLCHAGHLWVIDGDAVRQVSARRPLPAAGARANLAMLLAQLPPAWDDRLSELLPAYAAAAGADESELAGLREEIARFRAWRLRDYLAKTVRDCTLFAVEQSTTCFRAVLRQEAAALAVVLASPDAVIDGGELLKDGATCTVARVLVDRRELVIKRYNLKSLRHALGRLWRPSRAWHSWREGQRLQFLGISTPAPLALIEERAGPLRRRAWLICEYCRGPNLLTHLSPDCAPPSAEARAILDLFESLCQQRISHGDLKATNLLWHDNRVLLIDLDAVVQHRTAAAHARAWRRDRARLLRNWSPGSALHRWLDDRLPAA